MAEVSVYEARNNLSRLIRRAQAGEETIITSHGRPVARLVPVRSALSGNELADWLRERQVPAHLARTKSEADADLAVEREGW